MLTLREMMTALYIDGGPYCAEACAWLHDDDDDADTLDLVEYALDAFCAGELDAVTSIATIARIIGYRMPLAASEARHG
jgi:hypothetical protein